MGCSPVGKKAKAKRQLPVASQPAPATAVRQYESAKATRRTSTWLTYSTGANSEVKTSLVKLRDRHRALARDNAWAVRAIDAICNNTVGAGIQAQWSSRRRQARWREWFETTRCDWEGRQTGYGLQAQILRAVVESGEVLVRRRFDPRDTFNAIPLKLQVLEADYLDLNKTEGPLADGGWINQGIEFDAEGRRRGYWVFREHPGDQLRFMPAESVMVPASEILHLYRAERPGQVRGVPWGRAVMLVMRALDDYQDAQLERQRLAACFMAFRRVASLDEVPTELQPDEYSLLDKLEPGAIEWLLPGTDMTFATPPQPEDDGEFVRGQLRKIAAGYGIPYEILTGDLSEVNFSSARMGWQEFARNIDAWRWQLLAPQLLTPLANWYLEAESLAINAPGRPEVPLWTAPARVMVDEAREIPALLSKVRMGLLSMPEAIRQAGYDPDTTLAEIEAWNVKLDTSGVALDSDPRQDLAKAASPAEPPSSASTPDRPDDDADDPDYDPNDPDDSDDSDGDDDMRPAQ